MGEGGMFSPKPLLQWGWGYSFPSHHTPLNAFGV